MSRRLVVVAVAITAAALTVVAVLFTATPEERMPAATESEALAFGGVVLPPGADVLGVKSEKGVDQLYVLAVALDTTDVPAMLDRSSFAEPLQPGRPVFMPPVADYSPGTAIASAQDRRGPVTREVLVDRTDPERAVVHWWLFTT